MKNDIISVLNQKLKELSSPILTDNSDNEKIVALINMVILISLSQTKIWKCHTKIDIKNLNVKHILYISKDKSLTKKQKASAEHYLCLIKAHHVDEAKNLYKTEKQHELLINKIIELIN